MTHATPQMRSLSDTQLAKTAVPAGQLVEQAEATQTGATRIDDPNGTVVTDANGGKAIVPGHATCTVHPEPTHV